MPSFQKLAAPPTGAVVHSDGERFTLALVQLTRTVWHPQFTLETAISATARIAVGLAIDDFGTEYASLTYLKRLPVDVLKIDRSFVENLPGAVVDTVIVEAVVQLAGSLGMHVIAEGVETVPQQDALLGIGVRRMQGWLYGKAMPQESICALLTPEVA